MLEPQPFSREPRKLPEARLAARWTASLRLEFDRVGTATRLKRREHLGPLVVQKPFYPEGSEVCHVYLVHPPGGVVGGDCLAVDLTLRPHAHALVTTPACTKFYRSAGPIASQMQRVRVEAGAICEWLPQETLLFDGARVDTRTRVEVYDGARFSGWEIFCLGRPACGEKFGLGRLAQRFELWRDGSPLVLETLRVSPNNRLSETRFGLDGKAVTGSMLFSLSNERRVHELAESVRAEQGLFGITQLRGAVVCRYLGESCVEARRLFERVWASLRRELSGREAHPPRIWAT